MQFIISGSRGTDDPTMATLPFMAAKVAKEQGHDVVLWLWNEAVTLGRKGIADTVVGVNLAPVKDLLAALPFSERLTITPPSPAEIIAYAESMQWIRRVQHPLGDVLMAEGDNAVLLSYFRNNVQHVFVAAAWIACCFLNNRRMSRSTILRIGRLIYPFIQAELFLH